MKAYVTVITNKSYVGGALVLIKSLELVNSKYPIHVIVPEDVDATVIEEFKKRNITYYTLKRSNIVFSGENSIAYWQDTFFKLEIFNLCLYEKIVFVDADMVVLKNIDHLFDCPHMSCVAAGLTLHKNWVNLNSGIMVIEPNETEYHGLIEIAPRVYRTLISEGKGVGDQDVINEYYNKWKNNTELHLGQEYNVMLGYGGSLKKSKIIKGINDICVYHFTGKEKPWRKSIKENTLVFLKLLVRGRSFIDIKALLKYREVLKKI